MTEIKVTPELLAEIEGAPENFRHTDVLLSLVGEVRRLREESGNYAANTTRELGSLLRRAESAEASVKELEAALERVREIWLDQRRDMHGGRYFPDHQEQRMEKVFAATEGNE